MKRTMFLFTLTMTTLLFTGCASGQAKVNRIDIETAKAAAIEAAGFSASEVSFLSTELDSRNGIEYYDVDFSVNGREYDYDIDALTGAVIGSETPENAKLPAENPPSETASVSDNTPVVAIDTAPEGAPSDTLIGEEKAKELALAHAGLSAEQAHFVKSGLDRDDGHRVYDVEFYSEDYTEYDYDIDAVTGEILSFDHDAEYYAPASKGSDSFEAAAAGSITEAQAKEIALAQVPDASESDIREFEVDYDDGRLEYEGTIYYDHMEYEFEIDGYSGAIRNWDVESIYD